MPTTAQQYASQRKDYRRTQTRKANHYNEVVKGCPSPPPSCLHFSVHHPNEGHVMRRVQLCWCSKNPDQLCHFCLLPDRHAFDLCRWRLWPKHALQAQAMLLLNLYSVIRTTATSITVHTQAHTPSHTLGFQRVQGQWNTYQMDTNIIHNSA